MRFLGVLFGAVLALSCNGDDGGGATGTETDTVGTGGPVFECNPGDDIPCTCNSGDMGTQLCLPSGFEAGPCMCDSGTTTGMTTTSATETDSASTSTTTGTTTSATDTDTATTGTDTGVTSTGTTTGP